MGTRCVFRVLRLKPALHAYFFLRAGGAEKPGRSSARERFYERTFRTREEGFSRERVVSSALSGKTPLASANDLHQALARKFRIRGFSAPARA